MSVHTQQPPHAGTVLDSHGERPPDGLEDVEAPAENAVVDRESRTEAAGEVPDQSEDDDDDDEETVSESDSGPDPSLCPFKGKRNKETILREYLDSIQRQNDILANVALSGYPNPFDALISKYSEENDEEKESTEGTEPRQFAAEGPANLGSSSTHDSETREEQKQHAKQTFAKPYPPTKPARQTFTTQAYHGHENMEDMYSQEGPGHVSATVNVSNSHGVDNYNQRLTTPLRQCQSSSALAGMVQQPETHRETIHAQVERAGQPLGGCSSMAHQIQPMQNLGESSEQSSRITSQTLFTGQGKNDSSQFTVPSSIIPTSASPGNLTTSYATDHELAVALDRELNGSSGSAYMNNGEGTDDFLNSQFPEEINDRTLSTETSDEGHRSENEMFASTQDHGIPAEHLPPQAVPNLSIYGGNEASYQHRHNLFNNSGNAANGAVTSDGDILASNVITHIHTLPADCRHVKLGSGRLSVYQLRTENGRTVYAPGETVKGSLFIKTSKVLTVSLLRILFQGRVVTKYHQENMSVGDSSTSVLPIFKAGIILVRRGVVVRGLHEFKFEFFFPAEKLPASYSGTYGSISYEITSEMYFTAGQRICTTRELTLPSCAYPDDFPLNDTGVSVALSCSKDFSPRSSLTLSGGDVSTSEGDDPLNNGTRFGRIATNSTSNDSGSNGFFSSLTSSVSNLFSFSTGHNHGSESHQNGIYPSIESTNQSSRNVTGESPTSTTNGDLREPIHPHATTGVGTGSTANSIIPPLVTINTMNNDSHIITALDLRQNSMNRTPGWVNKLEAEYGSSQNNPHLHEFDYDNTFRSNHNNSDADNSDPQTRANNAVSFFGHLDNLYVSDIGPSLSDYDIFHKKTKFLNGSLSLKKRAYTTEQLIPVRLYLDSALSNGHIVSISLKQEARFSSYGIDRKTVSNIVKFKLNIPIRKSSTHSQTIDIILPIPSIRGDADMRDYYYEPFDHTTDGQNGSSRNRNVNGLSLPPDLLRDEFNMCTPQYSPGLEHDRQLGNDLGNEESTLLVPVTNPSRNISHENAPSYDVAVLSGNDSGANDHTRSTAESGNGDAICGSDLQEDEHSGNQVVPNQIRTQWELDHIRNIQHEVALQHLGRKRSETGLFNRANAVPNGSSASAPILEQAINSGTGSSYTSTAPNGRVTSAQHTSNGNSPMFNVGTADEDDVEDGDYDADDNLNISTDTSPTRRIRRRNTGGRSSLPGLIPSSTVHNDILRGHPSASLYNMTPMEGVSYQPIHTQRVRNDEPQHIRLAPRNFEREDSLSNIPGSVNGKYHYVTPTHIVCNIVDLRDRSMLGGFGTLCPTVLTPILEVRHYIQIKIVKQRTIPSALKLRVPIFIAGFPDAGGTSHLSVPATNGHTPAHESYNQGHSTGLPGAHRNANGTTAGSPPRSANNTSRDTQPATAVNESNLSPQNEPQNQHTIFMEPLPRYEPIPY